MAFLLQGVVAEATLILDSLHQIVEEFHKHGLYLFTWGDVNNQWENYVAQKAISVDGIILDDVARVTKASGKRFSLFNKPISSPASFDDISIAATAAELGKLTAASPRAATEADARQSPASTLSRIPEALTLK